MEFDDQADPRQNKTQNFGKSFKRLIGLLLDNKPLFIFTVFLALISVVLSTIVPYVLGRATNIIVAGFIGSQVPHGMTKDQALSVMEKEGKGQAVEFMRSVDFVPGEGINFTQLGQMLMIIIIIYFVSSFFQLAEGWLLARIVSTASYKLRQSVEDKLAKLPFSYFQKYSRGDVMSRATNDIDNITNVLNQLMSQVVILGLTLLIILVMMFWISWILALITLATIPVSAIVVGILTKYSQPRFVKQWQSVGQLNGIVEETFTGQEIITVFGQEKKQIETFTQVNQEVYKSSSTAQFLTGMMMPLSNFISNLGYVLIAIVGAVRVATGAISIGEVQSFIQYSRQFSSDLGQMMGMSNLVQSGVASAERVFELVDAPEEEPTKKPYETLADAQGHVVFDNVNFAYDPEKPLIEDLSLEALPGQTVAIVGPTGAGKTTIVNLLMRFFDVDSGKITIDGKDISHIKRHQLRQNFGMVLQDAWLFGGTIHENLAYGAGNEMSEEIIEQRVQEGAEAAYIDHFIHSLPEGYETVVEEEGAMSQGQRQLMTIARAWISDPAILILDEATSSVDTRTEAAIQQAMAELRKSRTSFVIAHRLSTIRDADIILVLNDGHIIEQGNHEDLLKAGGAYKDLYESQFDGQDSQLAEAVASDDQRKSQRTED